jgi:hypothetical protein
MLPNDISYQVYNEFWYLHKKLPESKKLSGSGIFEQNIEIQISKISPTKPQP